MITIPLPLLIIALTVSLVACQPRDADPTADAAAAPSSDMGSDAQTRDPEYCPNTEPTGQSSDFVEGCQFDGEWTEVGEQYCNPVYGPSDDCYGCIIERCCLQVLCARLGASKRITAHDGPHVAAEWSEYALDSTVDPNQFKPAYSMHVACARACVDAPPPEVGAEVPMAERTRLCADYCTDLITPSCWNANAFYWYREGSDSLFECMFAGAEANETLVDGYAYASWVRPGPNEPKPYVPRFADSSCAEVCFAPR